MVYQEDVWPFEYILMFITRLPEYQHVLFKAIFKIVGHQSDKMLYSVSNHYYIVTFALFSVVFLSYFDLFTTDQMDSAKPAYYHTQLEK